MVRRVVASAKAAAARCAALAGRALQDVTSDIARSLGLDPPAGRAGRRASPPAARPRAPASARRRHHGIDGARRGPERFEYRFATTDDRRTRRPTWSAAARREAKIELEPRPTPAATRSRQLPLAVQGAKVVEHLAGASPTSCGSTQTGASSSRCRRRRASRRASASAG